MGKVRLYIVLVIVVAIQILMMFQGFDVCDDGWVLTFYQQIFSNPESVEYNFLYWFSGIIGGIWYKLFEDGGILWFRFLAILVNTATFLISYSFLRKHINKIFLLFSLVMVLFVNDYGFLTFYHNQLTALLVVIIIYIMYKAIIYNSLIRFFLAGFILSFTIFTRVPNAVLYVLVLVIPYAYYLKKLTLKKALKPIIVFLLGSFFAYLSIFMVLLILGQVEIMKNALLTIVDLGNTNNSSHNFIDIFRAPIYNYNSIFVEFAKWVFISLIVLFLQKITLNNKTLQLIVSLISIALFFFWFNTGNIYPVYALCLLGSFLLLFIKRVHFEVKLIALMSFLILITLSLGSAGGVKNSGYMAIWIGLPLFFYFINQEFVSLKLLKGPKIKPYLWSIIIAFLLVKAYNIPQQTYFDLGSRFDKTFIINNNRAKGIYTTQQRATIVNELLANLEEFVKPNDYLLAYDKIPMVHFLTETKPYMYNSWVWIYDYNSFEKKLTKAEREITGLPIVVQQKFETIYEFKDPVIDYMSVNKENTSLHSNERNKIMNSYLKRNNYQIVWSNEYFNIYKSEKN